MLGVQAQFQYQKAQQAVYAHLKAWGLQHKDLKHQVCEGIVWQLRHDPHAAAMAIKELFAADAVNQNLILQIKYTLRRHRLAAESTTVADLLKYLGASQMHGSGTYVSQGVQDVARQGLRPEEHKL